MAPAESGLAADLNPGAGRDFPKTLIFDEPGIDDEISLPTVVLTPQPAGLGAQTDTDFEIDKRITERLSVQINFGYSHQPLSAGIASGWQDTAATLKAILDTDRAAERLVSLSLSREFGGTGAARIGSARHGASSAAINVGQGFAALVRPAWLKPFALTSSVGYIVPDSSSGETGRRAMLSGSLQYSLDVLGDHAFPQLPALLRPFIPIVECVYLRPTSLRLQPRGTVAPGLIYAGAGFQLAAEALVPFTPAAGSHAGFIAQLNISLSGLHIPALARPLF